MRTKQDKTKRSCPGELPAGCDRAVEARNEGPLLARPFQDWHMADARNSSENGPGGQGEDEKGHAPDESNRTMIIMM